MKAAKFVLSTDHKAGFNHKDSFIRLDSTKLQNAMAEAYGILFSDENLFCTTLYELVPGTKGTEYRPVARNYGHGGFYVAGCGSWDTNHHLNRVDCKTFECFEVRIDWNR